MDFSYSIDPGIFIIPNNHQWNSLTTRKKYRDHYRFICIGQETDGIFGIFDGVNERGFAAAALYFEGDANYDLPIGDKEPVASIDFLHYILGRSSSVDELSTLLESVRIVGVSDPVTNRAAPLHWMAADRSGKSVVIEQTKTGLHVMTNPIGVMTNSPDFSWHMTNLRNYVDVSPRQESEAQWGGFSLKPFGQGAGTSHLPGRFTSPDRFVRTGFLKTHIKIPENRSEAIMSCFHVMNSVFIPKGIVITDRGTVDYTKYVAFMNTNTCEYYFKTYDNNQIMSARLWNHHLHGTEPVFLGDMMLPVES